jgi:hypothetical protein
VTPPMRDSCRSSQHSLQQLRSNHPARIPAHPSTQAPLDRLVPLLLASKNRVHRGQTHSQVTSKVTSHVMPNLSTECVRTDLTADIPMMQLSYELNDSPVFHAGSWALRPPSTTSTSLVVPFRSSPVRTTPRVTLNQHALKCIRTLTTPASTLMRRIYPDAAVKTHKTIRSASRSSHSRRCDVSTLVTVRAWVVGLILQGIFRVGAV